VNIDCDQKILRGESQSHNPQRPRLSAVSMRPRTASLIRSPSRAPRRLPVEGKAQDQHDKAGWRKGHRQGASERQIDSIFS